jgi:hypothetical protein
MPRTIYIQGDNASDNKCWSVLLYLAMLVYHGYTLNAYISFLIVGHTHEDIDQVHPTYPTSPPPPPPPPPPPTPPPPTPPSPLPYPPTPGILHSVSFHQGNWPHNGPPAV